MVNLSINTIMLLALLFVQTHDIIPHDHEHDAHSHHEMILEQEGLHFESTHHSSRFSHQEHNFFYLTAKKNNVKANISFNKEFYTNNLFKDKNLDSKYFRIIVSDAPKIQFHELACILLMRAPPVLFS